MIDVSYEAQTDEWVIYQVDIKNNDSIEVARLSGVYHTDSFEALAYFKESVFGKLSSRPFIERALMKCLFKV